MDRGFFCFQALFAAQGARVEENTACAFNSPLSEHCPADNAAFCLVEHVQPP